MTDTCLLEKQILELRLHLDNAKLEVKSLRNGKKASSTRIRKSLQNIKTSSHAMRKSVMTYTKEMPTKPRATKKEPVKEVLPVIEPVEPVKEKDLELPPSPSKLVRAKRVPRLKTPPKATKK